MSQKCSISVCGFVPKRIYHLSRGLVRNSEPCDGTAASDLTANQTANSHTENGNTLARMDGGKLQSITRLPV